MFFVVFLYSTLTMQVAARPESKAAPAKTASPRTTAKAAPVTVPAGAKAVGPAMWEFRDAAGKEWVYRQTPFGISRSPKEAMKQPSATAPKPADQITAVEEGGQVRFTRSGPFGSTEWTKRVADLTDTEREALERARKQKASPAVSQ